MCTVPGAGYVFHWNLTPKWESVNPKWYSRTLFPPQTLDGSGVGPSLWHQEGPMLHSILIGVVYTAVVLAPCAAAMFLHGGSEQ
jgi:hypothetical protein